MCNELEAPLLPEGGAGCRSADGQAGVSRVSELPCLSDDCLLSGAASDSSATPTPSSVAGPSPSQQPSSSAHPTRYAITYRSLFWLVWGVSTLLWVSDRLWWNLWPRESFGSDGFGTDRRDLREGPWSVKMYDLCARVSWRVCIASLNGCLVTMMSATFNSLRAVQQRTVDLTSVAEDNISLHRTMGWITALATVPHVWSILLPSLVSDGWGTVTFLRPEYTGLRFPISETKPAPVEDNSSEALMGCFEIDLQQQSVCINSDDLGRLIGMTLLFCVFLPLSRWGRLLALNFNFAKALHVLLAAAYIFDLTRRRTHPHTWVINLPVLLFYLADAVAARCFYRAYTARARVMFLDSRHLLVYWKLPHGAPVAGHVGDHVYLRQRGASGSSAVAQLSRILEPGHPFTVVRNHFKGLPDARLRGLGLLDDARVRDWGWEGHKFAVGDSDSEGAQEMRRMPTVSEYHGSDSQGSSSSRSPCLCGQFDPEAHIPPDACSLCASEDPCIGGGAALLGETRRDDEASWDCAAIVQIFPSGSRCLRPMPATQGLACERSPLLSVQGPYHSVYSALLAGGLPQHPLVLVGSGTGGAYLVDFVGALHAQGVKVLGVPVSIHYTSSSVALFQFVTDMLCAVPIENLSVHAALTSHPLMEYEPAHAERDMQVGRLGVQEILAGAPSDAVVCFCGAPSLHKHMSQMCAKFALKFMAGTSFN